MGMAAMRTPTSLASLMSWRERIRSGFSKEAWRMGMGMGRLGLTRRNEGAGAGFVSEADIVGNAEARQ